MAISTSQCRYIGINEYFFYILCYTKSPRACKVYFLEHGYIQTYHWSLNRFVVYFILGLLCFMSCTSTALSTRSGIRRRYCIYLIQSNISSAELGYKN